MGNNGVSLGVIWERLRALLIDIGGVDPALVSEDTSIDDNLSIESVAFVEITIALEEDFQIELDPLEILERKYLGSIADYIHSVTVSSQNRHVGIP